MPGCILNATGEHFDVDAFLSQSPWRDLASVFHRGEPSHLKARPTHEGSGFSLGISDYDEDELEPQWREAMGFVQEEREEVERLAAFPGVECVELRIGVFWQSDTLCQFHTLPCQFMGLVAGLGVAVTLCVYAASDEEPGAERTASPNGFPAERFGSSGVSGGPPSVS
jgi:hypothetical protein